MRRSSLSYAHIDDQSAATGQGWVANFQRALEIRLAQLLGEESTVWRDPKLPRNVFDESLRTDS